METGEWRLDHGHWTMKNGHWRMDNGDWRPGNGEWRLETGDRRIDNGDWRMETGEWQLTKIAVASDRNRRFPGKNHPRFLSLATEKIYTMLDKIYCRLRPKTENCFCAGCKNKLSVDKPIMGRFPNK